VHRGVYAVGHSRLSKEGRWLAAVLACGQRAVLSHGSAAAPWDLLPVPGGSIDVTIPNRSGRRERRGISVHRSGTLSATSSTRHLGIPVTTPARTLDDLRRVMSSDRLAAVIRRAEVLMFDGR
jgi:hypothetical protein